VRQLSQSLNPMNVLNPLNELNTLAGFVPGGRQWLNKAESSATRWATNQAGQLYNKYVPKGLRNVINPIAHSAEQFADGAYHGIHDPMVALQNLSPTRLLEDPKAYLHDLAGVGKGLAYGATHPLEFGKTLIDYNDLKSGNYARWLGNLTPAVAATILSGGSSDIAEGAADAAGAAAGDAAAEGAADAAGAAAGDAAANGAADAAGAASAAGDAADAGSQASRLSRLADFGRDVVGGAQDSSNLGHTLMDQLRQPDLAATFRSGVQAAAEHPGQFLANYAGIGDGNVGRFIGSNLSNWDSIYQNNRKHIDHGGVRAFLP